MAYSESYYKEKKEKLFQRKQVILQKYVSEAFSFTQEMLYVDEQIKELEMQEMASKEQPEQVKPKK